MHLHGVSENVGPELKIASLLQRASADLQSRVHQRIDGPKRSHKKSLFVMSIHIRVRDMDFLALWFRSQDRHHSTRSTN